MIWVRKPPKNPLATYLRFDCIIKSRGRTGAQARAKLMRLSPEEREPILSDWLAGKAVEL